MQTKRFKAKSGLLDTPKLCSESFRVCRKFHNKIRKAMLTGNVEHGGDTRLDFSSGYVFAASTQKGSYANVDLKRGIIDWHTHPDKCLNDETCTIGLPSPSDMANVAIGARMGNQAHMVYSREGTYTIQVTPEFRRRLTTDGAYANSYPVEVNEMLLKVFTKYGKKPLEQFRKGHMTAAQGKALYTRFTDEYTRAAEKLGFILKLFPGDAVPIININHECGGGGSELVMDLIA